MTTTEEKPTLSHDEIAAAVKKILSSNDIKVGSKTARTVECSFIQGMMVADPRYAQNAYLVICLMAGRSILDP